MKANWDQSLNLHAYDEVEVSSNYADTAELERYRSLLMGKSSLAAECLKSSAYSGLPMRVLEICSGSSRLLFTLDKLGLLKAGFGVEVSKSRHQFAEEWKACLGTRTVHNINCAADQYSFDCGEIDAAVMIDGALSYLYPCAPSLPESILRRIHGVLKPGGKLLLEFDVLSPEQLAIMRRDGSVRVWNRGDDKDAFRYALYETQPMNWDQMVVQNCSTYLHRNGAAEKVKRELYKYYAPGELDQLLSSLGFHVKHFGSFQMTPFDVDSRSLVTVAEKR